MSTKKPWIIDEWKKNSSEIIRVSIGPYRGKDVISIRTWYSDDNDERKPGKQGASYELKHLKKISKAMKQAYDLARKNKLI